MDEEQKKGYDQFSAGFGVEEFLRFGCAFVIWQGMGIGLFFLSGNVGYMLICIAIYFTFPTLTACWQPAYSLLRKILGNKNLSPKLTPYKRKWWNYIPLAIRLAISVALLIKGVEFIIK